MIGIIDYGMGNLRSVEKALEVLGYKAFISNNAEELSKAKGLILPGVGAFPDAMKNLKEGSIDILIKDFVKDDKPILGICLGMQLLLDVSYEVKECEGLGIIKGEIHQLPDYVKIPHMGWNNLYLDNPCKLLEGIDNESFVYFVHSYYAIVENQDDLKACTLYGVRVPAVVSRGKVFGAQFHPEKSGDTGMKILKNFGELVK
ncbi:MAG: imidazole glycerol phosphate synthase subunit HisH [Clostridiales bacterium]|uniref:imidazole glycerol phosphate synthase subunit HisH n=1 Tax=Clostridium sp. N3C TaxID=1776758 RepID=UPI00092E067C|nr:imidazole glycerol phosphate synthase subunit HisH [Clostridium sp. N3C]NLZ48146.1 imidazole glycerol phosphate synthase subunit HisH [Clostridiales bacterium]SCN22530.1 Imidazole glycerol phosphate synthase subunit HisH 1 [Clostridium sp. N3C]